MGAISTAGADQWRQQLARTVVYEAHTPVFFDLAIAECSGLSGYIPVASYPDLNEYYIKLAWSEYNRNAVL